MFPILYGVLGVLVGSFLNVCIYRLPRHQSVVFPRSHCPACNALIKAYDNIPILSYLILGGRCRACKRPISLQYPLVELINGIAFFLCARIWGISGPGFVNSIFIAAIIVLIVVDYRHQILPNAITIPGTFVGIVLSPFQMPEVYYDSLSYLLSTAVYGGENAIILSIMGSIVGALVGGGLLFIVGMLYKLMRNLQGIGMGDVKMMALVGAFLGWRLALVTILIGSVLGSLIGIFLILFRGRNMKTKLAFGTFLGPGAIIALFCGLTILRWYFHQP
jgi:leader peptidase (prepilin peptidase)/N-methyltransferase